MKTIIYGKGDFAKLVLHYIKSNPKYEVVGFCADSAFVKSKKYLNYPLYDIDKVQDFIDTKEVRFFLAVGYSSMPAREAMFKKIYNKGFKLINIYCENTFIDDSAEIGVNNIFMPKVLIEPFSKLGNNNIFWSNALICHDVEIGNNNFFASNTVIGGFSKIGNNNFFGFNSTVIDNITVGNNSIIGAMSLLLSNIDQPGKYLGIPAKALKQERI